MRRVPYEWPRMLGAIVQILKLFTLCVVFELFISIRTKCPIYTPVCLFDTLTISIVASLKYLV
jgi:hypothetical protein